MNDDYVYPGPPVSNPVTKFSSVPWARQDDGPHEKWVEKLQKLTSAELDRWRQRYDNYAWSIEQERKKAAA